MTTYITFWPLLKLDYIMLNWIYLKCVGFFIFQYVQILILTPSSQEIDEVVLFVPMLNKYNVIKNETQKIYVFFEGISVHLSLDRSVNLSCVC